MPGTDVGPLATEDVLQGLEEQVQKTIEMGARVLLGGKRIDRKGNFFAPTVLADIPKGSPAFEDELFGPVASLYRAKDMGEAIEIANNSIFGLGACAWTNDAAERDLFIDEIESGLAFINGMVASDPRIPFGGVKHSGYGRELSHHGIREFVNVKSVSIQEAEPGKEPHRINLELVALVNNFQQVAVVCDLRHHRFQPVKRFLQDTARSSKAYAQMSAGAGAKPSRSARNQRNAGLLAKLLAQCF